jgi:hypothetical protein
MATINAIEKRIRRKLINDGYKLCKTRNERVRLDMGDYYIINLRTGGADETHVDIEDKARELGVLRPDEKIE